MLDSRFRGNDTTRAMRAAYVLARRRNGALLIGDSLVIGRRQNVVPWKNQGSGDHETTLKKRAPKLVIPAKSGNPAFRGVGVLDSKLSRE
jgi:hypothetical protein